MISDMLSTNPLTYYTASGLWKIDQLLTCFLFILCSSLYSVELDPLSFAPNEGREMVFEDVPKIIKLFNDSKSMDPSILEKKYWDNFSRWSPNCESVNGLLEMGFYRYLLVRDDIFILHYEGGKWRYQYFKRDEDLKPIEEGSVDSKGRLIVNVENDDGGKKIVR